MLYLYTPKLRRRAFRANSIHTHLFTPVLLQPSLDAVGGSFHLSDECTLAYSAASIHVRRLLAV